MRLRKRPWAEAVLTQNPELFFSIEDLDEELKKYLNTDKISLEIGSGKGDFILNMAKKFPKERFLGVEMQGMALAIAARKILLEDIKNIRLINLDCGYLFEKIPDQTFENIFLNFSDPWPKKKQQKRRLTHPNILKLYHRILKDDGTIRFKTDNDLLFADSLIYFEEMKDYYDIISVNYDYDGLDLDDTPTEYETKFRALGTKIKRVIVRKK